jgi:alpha-pyrone synthase
MDIKNFQVVVDGPMLIAIAAVAVALLMLAFRQPKSKGNEKVYPMIRGMATGNPKYRVSQEQALNVAMGVPQINKMKSVLERIYGNSKISYRHMCVPDFTPEQAEEGKEELFYPEDGSFRVPVETRLEKFKEQAVPLVTDVCRRAIEDAGLTPNDISKLIVVSSTGFLGPGLDCELIVELGLPRSVDRSLIGFMGCAAAMNGFRIAMDFCVAHPGKRALMVCVELSSVHTTFEDDINDSILHAIFADGCAASVLEALPESEIPEGQLVIANENSYLMENTEDGITLSINENGISCTLSKHLPSYIAKGMGAYVGDWLEREGMKRDHVDFWAVHPGGRRIIEEAQNGLDLTEEDTADSWAVLDQFGNMLSPSVMFVLERVFKRHWDARKRGEKGYTCGLAFSFSPGVGAEGIMLKQL